MVLVLVLAAITAAAAVGPAVGSTTEVGDATRTIEETTVADDDSVEVVVEVTVARSGDRLTVTETPTPAFEDLTVSDDGIRYNGESVEPSLSVVENDIVIVGLAPDGGFEAGDTVRLEYTGTVPVDAADQVVEFDGEAAIDDQAAVDVTGEDRVTVEAADGSTDDDGETASDPDEDGGENEDGDGIQVPTPGLGIPAAILALAVVSLAIRRKTR